MFEIPEGYNIISEEELADMVRESEQPYNWTSTGSIKNGLVQSDIHFEGPGLVDCN